MSKSAATSEQAKGVAREGMREADAPSSWRNWRGMVDGLPLRATAECQLYSDAWFVAELKNLGPYSILNALPSTSYAGGMFEWKPALVLRMQNYIPGERPDMSKTSDDHYHGGWLTDEIAALLSLSLGARIAAGPIDREFDPGGDPLGTPRAHAAARLPILPHSMAAPQIPGLFGRCDLRDLTLVDKLPALSREAAIAIIKAARLFQQALWVADMSPETSWLLLVAALECAANFWDASRMKPAERLQRSYPDLVAILEQSSDPGLLDKVAQELHKLIAATGKFIGFCKTFAPKPPGKRPKSGRFDFSKKSYNDAIEKIYRYRSAALHGGKPFPKPMCDPPRSWEKDEVVEERPSGLASGTLGATWLAEDTPMHLHIFVHVTRGALLNWWQTLEPETGRLKG